VERFEPPTLNGSRLDYCVDWGCGYQAALYFCQQQGYYDAARLGGPVDVSQTVRPLSSNSPTCNDNNCQTFSFIECSGGLVLHFKNIAHAAGCVGSPHGHMLWHPATPTRLHCALLRLLANAHRHGLLWTRS
jgi:hypothetical protein